jgi:hypothetical protein
MTKRGHGHFWFGFLVIILGIYFLLLNLNLVTLGPGELFSTYWPVLLIIWGIDALFRQYWCRKDDDQKACGGNSTLWGTILIILGLVFIGGNLDLYSLDLSLFWKIFWPVVIILVGWGLIRGTARLGSVSGGHSAILSGIELNNPGWKLASGSYAAILGGVKMDLTVAEIPEEQVVLDLPVILGGIEILAPHDLEVEGDVSVILGGIDFFREESGGIVMSRKFLRKGDPASNKKLVIRANVILGGIEIK